MKWLGHIVAVIFHTAIWMAVLPLFVLSIPLSTITVMRVMGWDWFGALIVVVFGGAIPVVGWIGFVVATLLGAFYFVDAGFSWQGATSPGATAAEFQEITREQFLALGGVENDPRGNYLQLVQAALQYASASRVCGDQGEIKVSKDTLGRVLDFGISEGLLAEDGKAIQRNMEQLLQIGEA